MPNEEGLKFPSKVIPQCKIGKLIYTKGSRKIMSMISL